MSVRLEPVEDPVDAQCLFFVVAPVKNTIIPDSEFAQSSKVIRHPLERVVDYDLRILRKPRNSALKKRSNRGGQSGQIQHPLF